MEKNILSFKQFLNEEGPTGSSEVGDTGFSRPESEKEAKTRIAKNIVKNLFGDVGGLTGGVDSIIDETKEVKESLPYKGCGIADPFTLEKTPLTALTIKILLKYLQDKGIGNYERAITELDEKRSIILGIRNKISVKKESSNQDRFCDALYFVPSSAITDTTASTTGSTGATGAPEVKPKKEEKKIKSDDIFGRLGKNKKKNESIELINDRIKELNYVSESSVWRFDDFDDIRKEILFLQESKDLISNDKLSVDSFIYNYNLYEADKGATGSTVSATGSATGTNLGEKITPYQITTVPSLAYYGKKPMNPQGVGIKIPGDTAYLLRESTLGKSKYKMMVEAEKIKVGRYPIGVTKFETYKPADISEENCGMQIHRSSTKGVGVCVGPWSAGCQVFSDNSEWEEFISKAEKETMNNSKFIYALIQLDDIQEALPSALMGIEYSDTTSQVASKSVEDEKTKSAETEKPKIVPIGRFDPIGMAVNKKK